MDYIKTYTYDISLALIPLAVYLFMLYRYSSSNLLYIDRGEINYRVILICLFIYTTFGFAEPDTYHYHDIYDFMVKQNRKVHVEEVYYWLITVLPKNYYIWRFVIWGASSFIIVFLAKKISLHPYALGLVLPVLFLHQIVVTRGALGLSILLLSFYFFFHYSSIFKSIIVLSIGILISLVFHHSIPIFAILAVLALLIPFNRFTYKFSLILFPVLYISINSIASSFLSYGLLSSDTSDFASEYIKTEMLYKNINGYIADFFLLSPILYIVFYELPTFVLKFKEDLSSFTYFSFKNAYILFYLGFLFYNQPTSMWISVRTMHAGYFPLVLVLSYYFQVLYTKKQQILYYYLVGCTLLVYFLRLKSWV